MNKPLIPVRSIRSSIRFHPTLNAKIWRGGRMRPEVRLRLLRGAIAFYRFIGIPNLLVEDIVLTGSNAAYNYTTMSDIDVHLVVDFSALPDRELAENIFETKKALWSLTFAVKIRGHDLEFYVEDSAEPAESNGLYSILHGHWLHKPEHVAPQTEDHAVVRKVEAYAAEIDTLLAGDPSEDDIDTIWKRLRALRQNGLLDGGEFSVENMAYKTLRNLGYLSRLWDARTDCTTRSLSLEGARLENV